MMEIVMYMLKSSVCLGIFFLFYRIFLTRDTNFKLVRWYLLVSIVLSLTLPLNRYALNIDLFKTNSGEVTPTQVVATETEINQLSDKPVLTENTKDDIIQQPSQDINWLHLLINGYFLIVAFLLGRLLLQFAQLFKIILHSPKFQKGSYNLVYSNKISNSLSFFHWIILNKEDINNEEMDKILIHEKIHASQYHTFDLIVAELLAAVMWFNPAIWLMRNAIQLVHEYLADEGALSTGLDKLRYQALLVNQVAEEKLICLSSGFNHSLIKKRIVMMTKSKFNQKTKLKILALLPIAVVLFIGIACVNREGNPKVVTAVAPVRMNVLYIGVDNPMNIAVSGYNSDDLTVTIDNGTITKKDNGYIINPKEKGRAMVTVFAKGNKISETEFRVKLITDPVAKLAGKKGGYMDKSTLLRQKEIVVDLENFDFDARFTIVSFILMRQINGFMVEEESNSNKFTEKQFEMLKTLKKDDKFYIDDIVAVGPDGAKRQLPTMVFKITEE